MVDGAALEKRCAKAPRVRIPPSPPPTPAGMAPRRALASPVLTHAPSVRSLRSSRPPSHVRPPAALAILAGPQKECPTTLKGRSALDFGGRARRGTSGALYLQSAPAGLNSHPRSPFSRAAASSDVEDRVPRSGESRTVSGPEGSSTKRSSSGAAERPGPSRSSRWARVTSGRRWVHGNDESAARDRTGAS